MHTTTNPYTQLKTQIRHFEVLQTYLQATQILHNTNVQEAHQTLINHLTKPNPTTQDTENLAKARKNYDTHLQKLITTTHHQPPHHPNPTNPLPPTHQIHHPPLRTNQLRNTP